MDPTDTDLNRILVAKQRRRAQLAAKTFPEKIRLLVALQKMLAPLERARGRHVRVWEIEELP